MNRMVRPIMFAFEPDVVFQFTRILFGAAGAPTLDTKNSKGVCNVAQSTPAFTANTNTSTSLTSVSSFAGLYVGMTITGTGIPASTTISSMNPSGGTITLSQAATATASAVAMTATGGQYTITLGSQYTPFKRLDPYVKLLDIDCTFDMSAAQGTSTTGSQAPAAPNFFLVQNNVSSSQLANVVIQFGTYSGSTFTAANPAANEVAEVALCLCRSGAI